MQVRLSLQHSDRIQDPAVKAELDNIVTSLQLLFNARPDGYVATANSPGLSPTLPEDPGLFLNGNGEFTSPLALLNTAIIPGDPGEDGEAGIPGLSVAGTSTPSTSTSFVPYFIASGETFSVPINKQALFAMTIDNEGILDIDGFLIQVDDTGSGGGGVGPPGPTGPAGAAGPAGASSLVLLEEHIASASASLDFTAFISSAYEAYLFVLEDVRPATSTADLWARVGTGAGPTWKSGASDYTWAFSQTSQIPNQAQLGAAASAFMKLGHSLNAGATEGASGTVEIFNPASAVVTKRLVTHLASLDSAGNFANSASAAYYNGTTAVTGVQFLFSTGNITSGTIRVYGYAKAIGGSGAAPTISQGTYASLPASPAAGDLYLFTDSVYNFARYAGSAWNYFRNGFLCTDPNLLSWSWVNQGTSSVSSVNGGVRFTVQGSTGNSARLRVKNIANPTTGTLTVGFLMSATVSAVDGCAFGVVLYESGTTKLVNFSLTNSQRLYVNGWSNPTTPVSNDLNAWPTHSSPEMYMRIAIVGANYLFSLSADGVNFTPPVLALAKTTRFTTAADQWGIYGNTANTPAQDFFGTIFSVTET